MDRINQIIKHPLYQKYYDLIVSCETEREFCHHDMTHFLDVSRIAYILVLENKATIPKDIIYACGLLHDIGRHIQYKEGTPHEIASASLSLEILTDVGYSSDEINDIQLAILNHRNHVDFVSEIIEPLSLSDYLFIADKRSRPCHHCRVEKQCHWDSTKKNMTIHY